MKLTEKELNEFPLGTKIYTGYGKKYMKLDNTSTPWRDMKDSCWACNVTVLAGKIQKVEIPTYTEYIPPQPILDDKEKEYLSAVIRPWRDKVKCIEKQGYRNNEYICIETYNDVAYLPFFHRNTMYKGMKLNKEYSLKELRIVR